jgi:hypothetical protein
MNSLSALGSFMYKTAYVLQKYIFPSVDASLVFYYPLDSSNGTINAGTANYASGGLPIYDASMMGFAMNTYALTNLVTGLGDLSLNNTMGSTASSYVKTDTSFNLVPSRGLSISLWFSCSGQLDICGSLISLYQNSSYPSIELDIVGNRLFSGYYMPPPAVTYTATGTYTTSIYGNYTILKYTSGSGTFKPTNTNLKVGYLVVGGGSAGNPSGYVSVHAPPNSGKGGAGGNGGAIAYSLLNLSNLTINANIICNIVVGSSVTSNTNGNNSSLNTTIVAQGGTNRYDSNNTLYGINNTATASGGINNIAGKTGTLGGQQSYPASNYTAESNLITINDININSYYGGGGGGGGMGASADSGGNSGNGGLDGKGGASYGSAGGVGQTGYPGFANYGGGGGGGGSYYSSGYITVTGNNGGNGGSGVVIIYFPTIIS